MRARLTPVEIVGRPDVSAFLDFFTNAFSFTLKNNRAAMHEARVAPSMVAESADWVAQELEGLADAVADFCGAVLVLGEVIWVKL